MRKFIYQILILAIVLGIIGFVPVFASSSQQDAIDYIVSKGYWKATGDFLPAQAATRAETASVMANFLSDVELSYSSNYTDVAADDDYAGDISLATNLGLITGSSGSFRPDDAITKQEFAVMLMRAYEIAGIEILDTNYSTELIKDYESIADWAKASVTDALGNGFMIGGFKKVFNPAGTVTRGELAEAVYSLYYAAMPKEGTYTVRDIASSDNIEEDFTVINSGIFMQVGVGGVGVIARFNGAPGEIYVRRVKGSFDESVNNVAPAVCFVRVVGPDGNVICRVDMDYKDSGIMEKIINIPEGDAGIYQIQFVNGIHLDPISIGIKKDSYTNYGIRGEDYIMFTSDDSIPREGYIYIPEKVTHLSMGIGGSGGTVSLYTTDDVLVGSATRTKYDATTDTYITYGSSQGLAYPITMNLVPSETSDDTNDGTEDDELDDNEVEEDGTGSTLTATIAPNNVYKYKINDGFTGRMQITGITPVVYPTPEAALDLKSGYIQHTDAYGTLQLSGPLQKKARERMIEIYEELKAQGNESFTVDVSEYIPTKADLAALELDNAVAEAQLFSSYSHSIFGLKGLLATQCLDPSNPWFGSIVTRANNKETATNVWSNVWTGALDDGDYPKYDWQTGYYDIHDTQHAFTGALSINSELNAYYNNPVLAKRAELVMLFFITQMPADGLFTYTSTKGGACSNGFRTYENFTWGDQGSAESYLYVRNHFSPETKAITDEGMLLNADKLMNMRGQGPTNQLQMCMNGTIYTYLWSGEERYHENAKRQLMAMVAPCDKDYYHGQSKLGYFIESGGADGGSYGRMNEGLWCSMVWAYLTLPESRQDPELKAALIEANELYLDWDSYFYMTSNENFSAYHSANWTSRVNAGLGGHSAIVGNDYLMKIFPGSKKNWLVSFLNYEYENYQTYVPATDSKIKPSTGTVASMLSNDAWAKKHMEDYMSDGKHEYDRMIKTANPDSYRPTNSEMYFVWHGDQRFDDSEMPTLPFETEGDGNIFLNENGIVAVKHKGLYLLNYFNNALPSGKMSSASWMGGGPTSIWDDYFATTLYPKKPATDDAFTLYSSNGSTTKYAAGDVYKLFNFGSTRSANYRKTFTVKDAADNVIQEYQLTPEEMLHSCIVGTDANGNLIASGRESSKFSWVTEGESYKLSGKDSVSGKTFTWTYYLTNDGISIDGGVDSVASGEELYMQLPILVQKGATYTFDETNKRIVIEHDGNKITYQWYANANKVELGSKSTAKEDSTNYKYLRIKLTASAPYATVKVTRTLAS